MLAHPTEGHVNKHLSTLLKLGVTLLGLWLSLRELDLPTLGHTLRQANRGWLLWGLLLISASMVLRAWRWSLLLRGLGIHVSFWRLVALYFVGSFFNTFLPSGFGGDVVRVLELTKEVDVDVATGTVLLDRFSEPQRFLRINSSGWPLRNRAESTGAGAVRPQNHDCGMILRPAFPLIGAARLLTDGLKAQLFEQGPCPEIFRRGRQFLFQPARKRNSLFPRKSDIHPVPDVL